MFQIPGLTEAFPKKKHRKPSREAMLRYTFWEKGFGYQEFCEMPIPYIFEIVNTGVWVAEQHKKEMNKKGKR
jgi:hypothetical protein